MKLLVILRLRQNARVPRELLDAQLRATWGLHKNPAVRSVEQLADAPGAIVTVEERDAPAALALVEGLPLVRAELVTIDVLAVAPYVGWEQLFRGGGRQNES